MNIISAIISLSIMIFGIVPDFGFAGGGGSGSGGGGGSSSSSFSSDSSYSSGSSNSDPLTTLIVFIIITVFIVVASSRASKKARQRKLALNNSTPQEKWIHAEADRIFKAYQADWTNFNLDGIKSYATPSYFAHASLMLEALKNLHRVNKVSQLEVHVVYLMDPVNNATNLPANIRVEFEFSGLDEVVDTATSKKLYSAHARNITETWNFIYDGKTLKLSGISQPTESAPHLIKSLAQFAQENQLFYSPDWGRYALPSRGLIFGGATLSQSDVNNHIIGKWRGESEKAKKAGSELLIQLYTYSPTPNVPSSYYLVGQINVPKDYLGVIIKSKKYKAASKPPKSYDKFELEWPDFNQRYDVYASSRDALPAFELLNPQFMEYLYDKNLNYNLEVTDNVIYIFANVKNITEADYAELLDVLKLAHKELKM